MAEKPKTLCYTASSYLARGYWLYSQKSLAIYPEISGYLARGFWLYSQYPLTEKLNLAM